MGQWVFAEYAWTMFVRADLEAQVLMSHLVYRKSFLGGGVEEREERGSSGWEIFWEGALSLLQ